MTKKTTTAELEKHCCASTQSSNDSRKTWHAPHIKELRTGNTASTGGLSDDGGTVLEGYAS